MEVPDLVRRRVRTAGADDWLAELPDTVGHLARRWGLRVGRVYGDGTESVVVGLEPGAVLKLFVPVGGWRAGFDREERVLTADGGAACARLLGADAERGALLLERLGPSLADLALPLADEQIAVVRAMRRLWQGEADPALPGLVQQVDEIAEVVRRVPWLPAAVTDAALRVGRRLAADDVPPVLLHGDAHQWNTLQDPEDPSRWRFVDPDGLVGDPAYDVGVLMRERIGPLLADPVRLGRERAAWLASVTGTDAERVFGWGLLQNVWNALLWHEGGADDLAGPHAALATAWAPCL